MENNIVKVKESNLVFCVYPKIRYYYRSLAEEGFYLESGRKENYDESNKNFRIIKPIFPEKKDGVNLSFRFFNEYQFDAGKSEVKLEDGVELSFPSHFTRNDNFSPTFYFDSKIILLKDLAKEEEKLIRGYYREYIPSYNQGTFEAIDCVIKAQGKYLIPASPSFAVISSAGKLSTIKDGKIVEVDKYEEIPENEQYGFRRYCC